MRGGACNPMHSHPQPYATQPAALWYVCATVEREEQHGVQHGVEACAGQLAQRARLVVHRGEQRLGAQGAATQGCRLRCMGCVGCVGLQAGSHGVAGGVQPVAGGEPHLEHGGGLAEDEQHADEEPRLVTWGCRPGRMGSQAGLRGVAATPSLLQLDLRP